MDNAQGTAPVGKNVRTYRIQAGLTQGQLAQRAGLSQTTLSKVERCGNPNTSTLDRIATALNLPIIVFFAADDAQASSIFAAVGATLPDHAQN